MSHVKVICKYKPKHVMSKAALRLDIKTRKSPLFCVFLLPIQIILGWVRFCSGNGMKALHMPVWGSIAPSNFLLFILRHSLLSCPARFELTMELAILQPQPPEQAGLQACSTRLSSCVFRQTETSHQAATVNSDCPRQGCDSEHDRQGSLC